jgi:hypothetical protein
MGTKKEFRFLVLVISLIFPVNISAMKVRLLRQINPTTVEVLYDNGNCLTIDFYGPNIFRLFQDNQGGPLRPPSSSPPAAILVPDPRQEVGDLTVDNRSLSISSRVVRISFDKETSFMQVTDLRTGKVAVQQVKPTAISPGKTTVFLNNHPGEYYYGGGVQNGRFSHRGTLIDISNTNSWTDGGVASPAPFFWSTCGYGMLAYTFHPGTYDFGKTDASTTILSHETGHLDLFLMVDASPEDLLSDYYQLTGHPILLPKFAFYEGHLNAYNRDYWKKTDGTAGILFEDGNRYVESQKDNGGIKESLNGEKGNYEFSARAVIDRYGRNDMPLGWILPNDGYGAGYGQTETLDGNIANLKSFGDYARSHGVQVGLWTQSDLHPKKDVKALLQRDIVKEVRDAGVRVLKTDVAWVGSGYSFGLNGIADVSKVMSCYGNDARPFIITLDGWAGTQRYGGIWTGDQTGGEWEYIRFHIPTYIGAGLSGLGNITSDMDGIFGGKNPIVNVRDFEWKAFTLMQLNMDGWGSNPKYPSIFGEPATTINRSYLKLKSELLPYTYSLAHEAVDGLPVIRAMFLGYPSDYTHGTATKYQYMFGPSFIIAPIYQNTASDPEGNDIRNNIYLPEGTWYDYFSGETYTGGRVINSFKAPLWKLPVFVKEGAIIPMSNPSNNPSQIDNTNRIYEIYPSGTTTFTQYDDDGATEQYRKGKSVTTHIISSLDGRGNLTVTITPAQGNYLGFEKHKGTMLVINTNARPGEVKAMVGKRRIHLKELSSGMDTWNYDPSPNLNRFFTKGSRFSQPVCKNPQIEIRLEKTDITTHAVTVSIKGFKKLKVNSQLEKHGPLAAPVLSGIGKTPDTITPHWQIQAPADYYEIQFNDELYSTIEGDSLKIEDLAPDNQYSFKLRAVNKDGTSGWATFTARTAADPLRNALRGLTATSTAKDMEGFEIYHLFDFSERGDIWHTDYYSKAVPFDLTVDLHSVNTLDKLWYVPRSDAGNGTITQADISVSRDGKSWMEIGEQNWSKDSRTKELIFKSRPVARYVKIAVKAAAGGFGSGSELYVFKVPGTKTILPGDINEDNKVDENDLTSYLNYNGLKKGDNEFDGYISNGDINGNGMIDAYDIANVAVRLEGGIVHPQTDTLSGTVSIRYDRQQYRPGEDITITVEGKDMSAVNSLGLIIPYDQKDMQFMRIDPAAVEDMKNMSYDRRHTDGSQVLYPTFTNLGEKPALSGSATLFVIHFKALRNLKIKENHVHGMFVDRNLNELDF